jgi:hypothetical protein
MARLDTSAGETTVKSVDLQQASVLNSPGHYSGMVSWVNQPETSSIEVKAKWCSELDNSR